jgi:hypothetical protein
MAAARTPSYEPLDGEREGLTSNSSVPGFPMANMAHRGYGSTTRCGPRWFARRGGAARRAQGAPAPWARAPRGLPPAVPLAARRRGAGRAARGRAAAHAARRKR